MAPKATNKFYWHMRRRNTPLLSLCSAFRHNIGFCYVIGAKLLPAKNTQVCTQYSGVRFKSFPWHNIIFVIDTYLFSNENHGEKWKYKIFGVLNDYYYFHNGNTDVSNTPPLYSVVFNLAAQAVFLRTIS